MILLSFHSTTFNHIFFFHFFQKSQNWDIWDLQLKQKIKSFFLLLRLLWCRQIPLYLLLNLKNEDKLLLSIAFPLFILFFSLFIEYFRLDYSINLSLIFLFPHFIFFLKYLCVNLLFTFILMLLIFHLLKPVSNNNNRYF